MHFGGSLLEGTGVPEGPLCEAESYVICRSHVSKSAPRTSGRSDLNLWLGVVRDGAGSQRAETRKEKAFQVEGAQSP